jgi:hypothetical protein
MTHRLLNLLTVLSLVVCMASAALWVRSYWSYDVVARAAYSGLSTEFISMRGRLIFFHFNTYGEDPPPTEWGATTYPRGAPMAVRLDSELGDSGPHWWNRLGFAALFTNSHPMYKRLRIVCIPAWLPTFALAAPPTLWWTGHRRRRKRETTDVCVQCGYDLTGNVSGVCPECGKTTRPA